MSIYPCSGGSMRMTERLGCFLGLVCFLALCWPLSASAADLSIQSDTLLRGFSRNTASKDDAAVVPVYQYLRVDVDNSGEPGLAVHLYGWGRLDLADNDYFEDATGGELLYGYLEYYGEQARFNARLGRQYVFEGVANESVDGLRLSSDLGRYFSGSIYAGQPVALTEENGRDGDSIFGGRLANHLNGVYDLGLSYKKIDSDGDDSEEIAGLDLSAYLPFGISLFGASSYNLDSEDWREHSYELRFHIDTVAVRPYFQKFRYGDYFDTGASKVNPFGLLAASDEKLTILGTDLTLPVADSWVLVGKVKFFDYDLSNDKSMYYGAQATWTSEGENQIGGELGFMAGDAAKDKYTLVRIFTYWGQMPEGCPLAFFSTDLLYVSYDQEIYGEDSSLSISLATGRSFLEDALEVKLSGDYGNDPYFDEDLRGMLTISYHFDRTL